MPSEMTHKHHVIPRHMGGSDDPSNLVELSVTDHAEAHKWLFIEHGKVEDAIAWLALYGQLNKQEATRMAYHASTPQRTAGVKKAIQEGRLQYPGNRGMIRNDEWRGKVATSMRGNQNTTGMKWYSDGSSEVRTKHEPPVGFNPGRLNKRFV